MCITYLGRVLFANRLPAGEVQVHVVSEDAPHTDFTVRPGLSGPSGAFSVSYRLPEPAAGDEQPSGKAVQFHYSLNGREKLCRLLLRENTNEYHLPERSPRRMAPSKDGFKFNNAFVGYPLPFSLPALPGLKKVSGIYGLCGGMSAAVYDYLLAGRQPPQTTIVPPQADPLQRYLFKRQVDSFGVMGETILRFAEWMLLPNEGSNGAWRKTLKEFKALRKQLEQGCYALLGIVYVDWRNGFRLWKNHQVLAYDYWLPDSKTFNICVYDPNCSTCDDVFIRAERVVLHTSIAASGRRRNTYGLKCSHWKGARKIQDIRGFFINPYTPAIPPEYLS